MAAITYWVDPVSGSDVNTGTSFGDALQTQEGLIDAIQSAGNGNDYTVNLVNTGDHNYDNNAGANQIDGQPASTFHIRGTDSAGDPAFARINAGPNSSINAPFLYIRDNAGILVEYIEHNTSAEIRSHAFILSRDLTTGEAEFRYCKFVASNFGSASALIRPISYSTTPQQKLNIHHCYFQNVSGNLNSIFPNSGVGVMWRVANCVLISDTTDVTIPYLLNLPFALPVTAECSNNTAYIVNANTNTLTTSAIASAAGFAGTCDGPIYKNNVVWHDQPDFIPSTWSADIAVNRGQTAPTATFSFDGNEDIGHNLFTFGPVLGAATQEPAFTSTIFGYQDLPWTTSPDYGVDTFFPGDTFDRDIPDSQLFGNPSSSYDWTPAGSALAITLPKDLRLAQYGNVGEGGSLPGALPAATTSYTLSIVADNAAPDEGQDVDLTITVEATGGADAEVDVTIPVGLTVTASTPSAGSYAAGTWTVTLAGGSPETLVLTADPDGGTGGTALQVDVEVSSASSPGPATPTSDSVILNVNKKTDFTVQALTTKSTMYPGETVTLRAAVSNDAGGFESDALFDIVLPSFITIVSTTATAGTYDSGTGQWTVTLAAGGAETLIFSAIVSLTATPSSEDFTVTVNAASDPPPGGNLADDTDSATLTVIARPAEESPALVPSIDALPLARPVMRLDFNTRLRTKRNRSLEHTIRDDVEQQLWSEFRSAQISIAPEATSTVNLGGVQIAEFLMVESDVAVEVSVNGTDAGSFMPAAEAVVLGEGRYTQLAIKNPSTTDTATVLVLVVD